MAISARACLLPRVSSVQAEQPPLIDGDPAFRHTFAPQALFGNRLAERHTSVQPAHHTLQRALGHADRAHAMMDTPWAQAALCDLEAAPFTQQHIGGGHAHIFENHFGMPMRCIIETEYRQGPLHGHAGMRQRHQDHRLLAVPVRVMGIGFAHHDQHAAARIKRA
jgi:hypothetical protein